MNILDQIKAEVERLKQEGDIALQDAVETNDIESGFVCGGIISTCEKLLAKLDTLQEQPVCEDVEEAAKDYADDINSNECLYTYTDFTDAFKAGAKWQKEAILEWARERKEQAGIGLSEYDAGHENGIYEVLNELINHIESL